MKLPASIQPENVVAICDTREQQPLDLSPLRTIGGTLDTGDYTVQGLEHVLRVERKSLPDLVGCVGKDRARFQREVDRLLAYQVRILVVESSWPEIELGHWRGNVKPEQVIGSLLGWQAAGLSLHLCHDHERAGKHVARLLFTVARRRYREIRTLVSNCRGST